MSDIVNIINTGFQVLVDGVHFIITFVQEIPIYYTNLKLYIGTSLPQYIAYPLMFMAVIAIIINIKRLVAD